MSLCSIKSFCFVSIFLALLLSEMISIIHDVEGSNLISEKRRKTLQKRRLQYSDFRSYTQEEYPNTY